MRLELNTAADKHCATYQIIPLRIPVKPHNNYNNYNISVRSGCVTLAGTALCGMTYYRGLHFTTFLICLAAVIAQSVWPLATGWTVRGSNPGGGEIFCTRPDRPWGPSSLLYEGYRIFPGGKAAGAWCWLPPPFFSAEVLKRVELYLYLPYGP